MLTLQFGQCGNQLGYSLFQQISVDLDARDTGVSKPINADYTQRSFEKWFTDIDARHGEPRRLARAVLVDTEHKVINKVFNTPQERWRYKPQNCVCQAEGGSANNWAYGNLVKGAQLKADILELVRREIEPVDHFEGVLFLLSSGGGTGSGVGSYSAQFLRDELPNKTFLASIVLPFASGEVGVQNYNSMLTLSMFHESVDLMLLFQNEKIHSLCTKILKNFETKLYDINVVISKKLGAVLQPLDDPWHGTAHLVSQIASHPAYRIASVKSTPHVSKGSSQFENLCSWEFYARQFKQKLKIPLFEGNPNRRGLGSYYKSVSNLLITRGSVDDLRMVGADLGGRELYCDWAGESRFEHLNHSRRIFNQEKFLALVTNNSQTQETMDSIVGKAWNAYTNAAFLHHYRRYGLEDDDFLRAFAKCERVIGDYQRLLNS